MPDFGHGPTRIQVDSTEEQGHARSSLDVEYGTARPGGVWYPSRVTYRRGFNDRINREQVAEVESAEFGVAIPPETFSYKGLDLPPGREILIKPRNEAMIWDGQELQPDYGRGDDRPDFKSGESRGNWSLWAGAWAAALGAAALIFRVIYPSSRRSEGRCGDLPSGSPKG